MRAGRARVGAERSTDAVTDGRSGGRAAGCSSATSARGGPPEGDVGRVRSTPATPSRSSSSPASRARGAARSRRRPGRSADRRRSVGSSASASRGTARRSTACRQVIVTGKAVQKKGLRSNPGRAAAIVAVCRAQRCAESGRRSGPRARGCRRPGRTGSRGLLALGPRTTGRVPLLARVHGLLDQLGVGENLIALGDVDPDPEPAAGRRRRRPSSIRARSGSRDAPVDLQRRRWDSRCRRRTSGGSRGAAWSRRSGSGGSDSASTAPSVRSARVRASRFGLDRLGGPEGPLYLGETVRRLPAEILAEGLDLLREVLEPPAS